MNEEQIKKLVQDEIMKILNQKSNFLVPWHIHNNVDAPYVQVNAKILTFAPTADFGNNGDVYLYDTGGVRRLYAKINATWYYVVLT